MRNNFDICYLGGSCALPIAASEKVGKMSHPHTSSNLASNTPHLLKHLTSGIMTVSTTAPPANADDMPPCKKLRLDIEAANNAAASTSVVEPVPSNVVGNNVDQQNHTSNSTSARMRLLEKRQARRAKLRESYKDNMSELFFLQSKGNVVDLPAFRKRPSQQYLNFLKSNSAPEDIMTETRLAVLGPNAVNEKQPSVTLSATSGKVTVSSAAMAGKNFTLISINLLN